MWVLSSFSEEISPEVAFRLHVTLPYEKISWSYNLDNASFFNLELQPKGGLINMFFDNHTKKSDFPPPKASLIIVCLYFLFLLPTQAFYGRAARWILSHIKPLYRTLQFINMQLNFLSGCCEVTSESLTSRCTYANSVAFNFSTETHYTSGGLTLFSWHSVGWVWKQRVYHRKYIPIFVTLSFSAYSCHFCSLLIFKQDFRIHQQYRVAWKR